MFLSAVNNQKDFSNNINNLNDMVQWNSWDCQIVSLDSLEKLIHDNEKLIKTSNDWHLSQSLSELGKRISAEPYFGAEAGKLAQFIDDLIPIYFRLDPSMPSYISISVSDIHDSVIQHLKKNELISFSQTCKQMHQTSAKWMPIKTEELLIDLFDLCMENKYQYNLNFSKFYMLEAESRFRASLNFFKIGSQEKLDALRNAFIPFVKGGDVSVVKYLPISFYEDKPLILKLIRACASESMFKYAPSSLWNKFEFAYLELLKKGKIQAANLSLDVNLIDNKMAKVFAELIPNKRFIQIELLNVPVKSNFCGSKVIDYSKEGFKEIIKAIDEKKYSVITTISQDGCCNYVIYVKTLENMNSGWFNNG